MSKPRPLPGRWVDAWCQDSDLASGVRLVLFALANYMDKRGVAWPSVSTLARDTGYSRRQVFNHLRSAHDSMWLSIESEAGPKANGGNLNLYRAYFPPKVVKSSSPPETAGQVVNPGSPPPPESAKVVNSSSQGGEICDTKVVNPTSTECPMERPITSREDAGRFEKSTAPSQQQLVEAIEGGVYSLPGTAGIQNFTITEARWLLDGLSRIQADPWSLDLDEPTDATELVATVLRDFNRKRRTWTRSSWVTWVGQAVTVRMGEDYDPSPVLAAIWPTGDERTDPDDGEWDVEAYRDFEAAVGLADDDVDDDDFIDRAFASKLARHRGRR